MVDVQMVVLLRFALQNGLVYSCNTRCMADRGPAERIMVLMVCC